MGFEICSPEVKVRTDSSVKPSFLATVCCLGWKETGFIQDWGSARRLGQTGRVVRS